MMDSLKSGKTIIASGRRFGKSFILENIKEAEKLGMSYGEYLKYKHIQEHSRIANQDPDDAYEVDDIEEDEISNSFGAITDGSNFFGFDPMSYPVWADNNMVTRPGSFTIKGFFVEDECKHLAINVGFHQIRMVCKHCDKEL